MSDQKLLHNLGIITIAQPPCHAELFAVYDDGCSVELNHQSANWPHRTCSAAGMIKPLCGKNRAKEPVVQTISPKRIYCSFIEKAPKLPGVYSRIRGGTT